MSVGVLLDVRATRAAELFLQQPPSDCADARLRDDPHRDGPRRPHRPHGRRASAENHPQMDGDTLLYRFTIDDPTTWAQPWTGEYTWPATKELLYEYACHEGNYALGNILRGARLKEAEDTKKKK